MALSRFVITATVTVPAGVFAPGAAGPPSTTGPTSSAAAPAAGTVITSQALAAGNYLCSWSGALSASAVAGDANNFGLYNGAALAVTSVNPGAPGSFNFTGTVLAIPSGGATVAIKNIGVGSATTTYTATLTTALLTSIPGATGGWAGPGAPPGWAEGFPVTFIKGTAIYADSTAGSTAPQLLYQAIGAGNLRAFIDGQDTVGRDWLAN